MRQEGAEGVNSLAVAVDPFVALVTRNWAEVGGWSLFLGLVLLIVIGAFREWWVPGARHARTEAALEKALDVLKETADQNSKLVVANEITKHFFEETTPKRGATRTLEDDAAPGGDAA